MELKLNNLLVASILLSVIVVSGCVTRYEAYLTPTDHCKNLKDKDMPNDYQDEYDQCATDFINTYETPDGCKNICAKTCADLNMRYQSSNYDAGGCHCKCS